MKYSIRFIAVIFMFSAFAKAQSQDSYNSLMMKYFKVSGIDQEYSQAYDGMFTMIKDAYQSQDVPVNVWAKFNESKSGSIAKLKGILASEYRSIFDTKDDLKNLIFFYNSPTGKQLLKDPSQFTDAQRSNYDNFKKTTTGDKLFGNTVAINKAKERASVYWSKELFCTTVSQLKELGYRSGMPTGNCQ